jgi:hypothetical protein
LIKQQAAVVAWTGTTFVTSQLVYWYHRSQPLSIVTIAHIDPILSCCYTEAEDAIIDTKHLALLGFLAFAL